ncbi:MAG: hypothetical protein OXG51_10055 [Gammaproteobacteria bacterium]|nr:hypothetical protein [Gammaproteobacteria bacterium]
MAIVPRTVARTARDALTKAQARYERWSGWWWAPPEYVATVEIAEAVHRLSGVDWVTPEHNVGDTLRVAGGGMGRPASVIPKAGRFDLVVWSGEQPAGVIEVKTKGYQTIIKDVERVCAAIRNTDAIDWGVVAFIYAWGDGQRKSGKERVLDRTARLEAKANEEAGKRGMKFTRHNGKIRVRDGGAWAAEAFQISRASAMSR